jgi:hypothetical protein
LYFGIGHTQIYAGNGYWYNGGAASSVPCVKYSSYEATNYFGTPYLVLRPVYNSYSSK